MVATDSENSCANSVFDKYYNSIEYRTYEELKEVHDILAPLVVSTIPFHMVNATKDEVRNKETELLRCELPDDKKIWGCVTYEDASIMNQAIVKRLDYLDSLNN